MAANLKLESFSDRELIHLLDDLGDHEGWVEVETMAARVGLTVDGMSDAQLAIHARRCVAVRLSWIRRLSGCVERDADKTKQRWRLTDSGRALVKAKLTKEVYDKLGNIGEFQALHALDALSRRYRRTDVKAANLMRREWTHGTHRSRK